VRGRAVGALLALALGLAVVQWRQQRLASAHVRYDRFDLPGFDAHVYVAMAEQPAFFTVAPWGYRVLTPWLVHLLPAPHVARAFRWVSVGALAAAGALLFVYLSLHFRPAAALLGSVAFTLSGPVGEAARYRFLVEPLTVALEIAFLLAIELGAGAGVLGLVALLGVLSKEFFVLLLPLPWLWRRGRDGDGRAARLAFAAAVPALAALVGLRLVWGPGLLPGAVGWGLAFERVASSWREWAGPALLSGVVPLALLGALRPAARAWRVPAAYVALVALVPPFLNPVAFFPADIPRLLLYVLPVALPLALLAVDRVWPLRAAAAPAPARWPRPTEWAAGLLALSLAVAVLAGVDRYRRQDLRGPRDGPRLLAFCRETLRSARRVERGQEVVLQASAHRFAWGQSDPGDLSRMRWFLGSGWGGQAHYGTADIRMEGREATLVVPVLAPRELTVSLEVEAPAPMALELHLGGQRVGGALLAAGPAVMQARLPAAGLVRGDNELRLRAAEGGLRLLAYRLAAKP
jgi:hypothetical protein